MRKSTVTDFPDKKNLLSIDHDTNLDVIKHSGSRNSIYMSQLKQKQPHNFDKNSIYVSHNYKANYNAYEQVLPRARSNKKFSESSNLFLGDVPFMSNQTEGSNTGDASVNDSSTS